MATKTTLSEVKDSFDHWRQIRPNRKSKIPIPLWRNAVSLTKNYSVSEIVKTLGLSGGSFNKNKKLYSSPAISTKIIKKGAQTDKNLIPLTTVPEYKPVNTALNSFIQIPVKQSTHLGTPRTTSITLQKGDTQLSLNCPSDEQLQLVLSTLFR